MRIARSASRSHTKSIRASFVLAPSAPTFWTYGDKQDGGSRLPPLVHGTRLIVCRFAYHALLAAATLLAATALLASPSLLLALALLAFTFLFIPIFLLAATALLSSTALLAALLFGSLRFGRFVRIALCFHGAFL